jgi:hypothetical protein
VYLSHALPEIFFYTTRFLTHFWTDGIEASQGISGQDKQERDYGSTWIFSDNFLCSFCVHYTSLLFLSKLASASRAWRTFGFCHNCVFAGNNLGFKWSCTRNLSEMAFFCPHMFSLYKSSFINENIR